MRNFKTIIFSIAFVAVIGFAINAFAHGGMGWGGHMMGPGGYGWHHGGDYGPGYNSQLSEEQYKQIEKQREAFLKETQDLRANLYDKERSLQNELAKDEPDAAKASALQKEISKLQAQLDQKRVDNMVKMREIAPEAGRGAWGGGPRMGYGPRGGMGYGPGGGYCWQ